MSQQPITTQRLTRAIVLAAMSLLWATNAQAEEQRCIDLAANCICSEPLNTATFTGGPPSWNPADSTSKQCSAEGVAGGAIARNVTDLTGSADATALAALPSGRSVSRFLRAGDGHDGIFFVGNGGNVSSSFVRLAARWYIYYTPTFEFVGEGSCENNKITEHNNGSRVTAFTDSGDLVFSTYNYLTFSPSVDCCLSGPGQNIRFPLTDFKGKWWRFEVVMTNRSGPNFDLKFYGKNVTDNGPELTIIDLSLDNRVNKLTPPSLMSAILVNNYRQGTCRGWIGLSHYMTAGWTTNAGQRIGAASEIESPGTIFPPPNLRVSERSNELRVLALTSVPTLPLALGGAATTGTTAARMPRLLLAPSR